MPDDHTQPREINIRDALGHPVLLWTEWDTRRGSHVVTCDICGTIVVLNKSGHPNSFLLHRHSKTCEKAEKKCERDREKERLEAIRIDTGPSGASPQYAAAQGSLFIQTQVPHAPISTPNTLFMSPLSAMHSPTTPSIQSATTPQINELRNSRETYEDNTMHECAHSLLPLPSLTLWAVRHHLEV